MPLAEGDSIPARAFGPGELLSVLTVRPLDGPLDYLAPASGASEGAYVEVPLGPRTTIGVVWGEGQGGVAPERLKTVKRMLDAPPMSADMRAFLGRAAGYTVTPMHAMLRAAIPALDIGRSPPTSAVYALSGRMPTVETKARRRVMSLLEGLGGAPLSAAEIASGASVSGSVVKGLVSAGALERRIVAKDAPYRRLDLDRKGIELTDEQAAAVGSLKAEIARGRHGATLLKGVTGSGKTEVYLEAATDVLREGRQVLILLPEIALTAQFLERVAERFGAEPGEWHSGVSQAERRRLWRSAAEGGVQLVVGARSALFLTFADLGLVIVDEEHDLSYKQDDGILYNARDMAVLRASICGARAVLATATPSLETWTNARSGKYSRIDLPNRIGAATMPDMAAIDMREEGMPAGRWISGALAVETRGRLERGEQSMLFLNRRGYAPITLCRACGRQIGCMDCDARMVEHRFRRRLVCHQCGASRPVPVACEECGETGHLVPIGPGIERLSEEASELFEGASIEMLSSDFSGSTHDLRSKIEAIARGDADIVVGTQLIAKGHNFPLLTLVGVIDADIGLHGSDLRAAERTHQVIRQVAGRAGRYDRPGLALIQTWQPEHPVIRAILSGDDEGFLAAEASERRVAGAPPYGRYAGIVLSGADAAAVEGVAKRMAGSAEPLRRAGAQLLGPAPAPIARIRGRTRFRLLVKADRSVPMQRAIRTWLSQFKFPNDVRLSVDIDPQRFL